MRKSVSAMAPKDWEKIRDDVAQKAIDAFTEARKQASAFLADHPEIKDTMHKVETEAVDRIKKILDSRK
jgi:hypothetical protein